MTDFEPYFYDWKAEDFTILYRAYSNEAMPIYLVLDETEPREADTLGCFTNPMDAHNAWKDRKLYYAKLLVDRGYTLSNKQSKALINRYT